MVKPRDTFHTPSDSSAHAAAACLHAGGAGYAYMDDGVVDQESSAVESSSHRAFLFLHRVWTTFHFLMSDKRTSAILRGCDLTTQSGGIWKCERGRQEVSHPGIHHEPA